MDLSTVAKNLSANRYNTIGDFLDDIALIWRNCRAFNLVENLELPILKYCNILEYEFSKLVTVVMNKKPPPKVIQTLTDISSSSSFVTQSKLNVEENDDQLTIKREFDSIANTNENTNYVSGTGTATATTTLTKRIKKVIIVPQRFCEDVQDSKRFRVPRMEDYGGLTDQEKLMFKAISTLCKVDDTKKFFGFPVHRISPRDFVAQYRHVIKISMDIYTIFLNMLIERKYQDTETGPKDLNSDMELIFTNSLTFNSTDENLTSITRLIQNLWNDFYVEYFGEENERISKAKARKRHQYGDSYVDSSIRRKNRPLLNVPIDDYHEQQQIQEDDGNMNSARHSKRKSNASFASGQTATNNNNSLEKFNDSISNSSILNRSSITNGMFFIKSFFFEFLL
jgi:hypothetical protein